MALRGESVIASSQMFNTIKLWELVQTFNSNNGDTLAQNQKELYEIKKNIALASKKNFTLERDIRNLDTKIALLVKNRLSLEEVIAQSGDISLINKSSTLKDNNKRHLYGKLFYLLQTDTRYIARLAGFVKISEIDNLLQTVMFTLYGNQYDEYEEHLLLSMFQKVLELEFSTAKGISGVMRANTASSRMMTAYTRRSPGQHYLKVALEVSLKEILADETLNLEVNPLKVYEQMINDFEATTGQLSKLNRKASMEEVTANADVQNLLQSRFHRLGALTDNLITNLISSIQLIPYGIRWICKQIKSLVKSYFPECTKANICSMIGGFFLLRYINPAIVTPQAFMLIDKKLSNSARRNLTLVAKILQNLANNVSFGGVKEEYMGPLNVVLDRNRDKLNDFLYEITNVSDLSDRLHLDRYIALGKKENPVINISLNEIYFIHALLKDHRESIAIEGEDHSVINKLLMDLGDAPPQLARKDNANIDLELNSSIKSSQEDNLSNTKEYLYAETKYLLLVVLKSMPSKCNFVPSVTIDDIILEAMKYAKSSPPSPSLSSSFNNNNHSMIDNIERLKENIQVLVHHGILRLDDDYSALRKDTILEILNHDDLVEKTKSDLERLRDVLSSIQEHHTFLNDQFDAFKEYLNNVRQNSNCSPKKKEKDPKNKSKNNNKSRGPFKYSHNSLMKDGVIVESTVPDNRRSSIYFSFSSISPGVFEVVVLFGRRQITSLTLQLDDLLEKQQNSELLYETDFLKLNVNLLIHLLNRDFVL